MALDPLEPPEALLQFDTDTIILVIGVEREKMLVHKSHAKHSKFLTAAFKEEWTLGAHQILLPDDETDTVRQYLHFLYTGKIASKKSVGVGHDSLSADSYPLHAKELRLLCRLYVLGEKYQDALFKNAVIDAMIAKHDEVDDEGPAGFSPTGDDVDILYRGTCVGSPVRRLMVDMHKHSGWSDWIVQEGGQNHEFLIDLCEELMLDRCQGRMDGKPWGRVSKNTEYHEHVEGS